MGGIVTKFAQRYPLIWSLFTTRLQWTLAAIAALFVITSYSQYASVIAGADGLFTSFGPIIGADFVVFYHAAQQAGDAAMSEIYDMPTFAAMLRDIYPGHGDMLFGWQYPPTMSLLIKPIGGAPYLVAFAVWVAAGLSLFVFTLTRLWNDRLALLIAVASPAVYYSIITGQTGFFTASLFTLSVYYAGSRPLIAGLAAALLTVKPQLGLLLPILFIVAGYWRTIGVAAVGTAILVALSLAAFGAEPWRAFFDAVKTHGGRMGAEGNFPAYKLVSPFGAASLIGLAKPAALALHGACALAIAGAAAFVWRRTKDVEIRLAVAASAALLVTPYAFFYEAAFLAPPTFLVAKQAIAHGWLRFERTTLVVAWFAVLMTPGPETVPGFPVSFLVAAGVFAIALRRAFHEIGVRAAAVTPDRADLAPVSV